MTSPMDRARLAAFVDGELSPEESAEVVMHLADHPDDQAYVDDLFAANAALAAAFAAPLQQPVPDRLLRTIAAPGASAILPFRRRGALLGASMAIAAALATVGLLVSRPSAPDLAIGPVQPGTELSVLLDTLPSGTLHVPDSGGELMMLATFPTPDGHCREVELIDRAAQQIALALACRAQGGDWHVTVALAEPLGAVATEDGFIAADGAEAYGLAGFLDQRRAGPALSPDEEASLIRRGWSD